MAELVDAIAKYYDLIGRLHLLWDFRSADLSDVRDEHFAEIAAVAATKLLPLEGRKTAYVVGDGAKYSRLCRYITVAFRAGVPAEYAVFLDRDGATEWLQRKY